MPMPQLKVRIISSGATPPVFASHEKTGGTSIASRSSSAEKSLGRTRGMFSGKSAAGDMRQRLDALRFADRVQDRLHIDARRLEQRLGKCRPVGEGRGI